MNGNKKCEVCGIKPYSCRHHYFPKSVSSALRYDMNNGIAICSACHQRIHSSDDPTINNAIRTKRGEEWLEDLEAKKRNTFLKTNIEYYEHIKKSLKLLIEAYESPTNKKKL